MEVLGQQNGDFTTRPHQAELSHIYEPTFHSQLTLVDSHLPVQT